MKSLVLVAMLLLLPLARADPGGAAEPTPASDAQQVLVLFELPPPHYRADGNYAPGYADASGNVARRRLATSIARSNGLRLVDDWPLPVLGVDCYVMEVPPSERPEEGRREARARSARGVGAGDARVSPLGPRRSAVRSAARCRRMAPQRHACLGDRARRARRDRRQRVQLDHRTSPARSSATPASRAIAASRPRCTRTAVAGIVAARADNHLGIVGIAPEARASWRYAPAAKSRCARPRARLSALRSRCMRRSIAARK